MNYNSRWLCTAVFLALSPFLASCESAEADPPAVPEKTDFADEREKMTAFGNYICARDNDSGVNWASSAAVSVLADETASKDDKRIALDLALRSKEQYEAEVEMTKYGREEPISPRLDPDDDGICTGWVWEKHIWYAWQEDSAEFTYATAREAGAL